MNSVINGEWLVIYEKENVAILILSWGIPGVGQRICIKEGNRKFIWCQEAKKPIDTPYRIC